MNNSSSQVTAGISRLCGKVTKLQNGWCHFIYRNIHYLNIPDDTNRMIRISIPHVVCSNDYNKEVVNSVINETNRDVKYIKVAMLDNGSVSMNYDHRIGGDEDVGKVVSHMISTLFNASEYMKRKLESK